ncbi:hypothetical protein BJX66DRAFT_335716 [Aspergillus keveii]|uniref:Uncharacterized protein n=1 Tax=Aspergillus keveii TaxID=714993 RepID=A0ABR4GDL4_9EURO
MASRIQGQQLQNYDKRGSTQKSFPAGHFSSEQQLSTHALETIRTSTRHQELLYTGVGPAWAEHILQYLEEKLRHTATRKHFNVITETLWLRSQLTSIHNCVQGWVISQMLRWVLSDLLNENEARVIEVEAGTTTKFLYPPYAGSQKEPDLLIRQPRQRLPLIVFEAGWSESKPQLLNDMNLWLVGGGGSVRAVVIVIWQGVGAGNEVSGTVELYALDSAGMPVRRQHEQVFPEPALQQARNQAITFTRRMRYGDAVLHGRHPKDVLRLELDLLRENARDALGLLGLAPA